MALATIHESRVRCFIFNQPVDAPTTTTAFDSPEELLKKLPEIQLNKNKDKTVQLPDSTCVWVDLQGATEEEHREAIQLLFPNVLQSQVDALLSPDTMYDVVELQPGKGEYIVGGIACSPNGPRTLSATQNYASEDRFGQDEAVLCLFVCNEQCLLTMHAVPFVGLAEVVHYAQTGVGVRGTPGTLSSSRDLASSAASLFPLMTGATILCALVCFTCETHLPNLTSLLGEVDCIDEMVMLVAPGESDQADLFRRVAVLRRRIATSNSHLYMKEKLLHELMGPTMRTAFVSRDPFTVSAYKKVLEELLEVMERLESARDTLNHANLNFVNAVSMRMSQASSRMDRLVCVLTQMATACIPANLLASIFGMNCKVPWNAKEYDNLQTFWILMVIIVMWMVLSLYAPVRSFLSSNAG